MTNVLVYRFSVGLLTALAALVAFVVQPPAPPLPAKPAPPRITVVGVGDILLGRSLWPRIAQADDPLLPFRAMAPLLAAADIAFGNLEGSFCPGPPYPTGGMIFRVHPRALDRLAAAGFDVVSVANNHFGDGGDACIRFSLERLRGANILPAGAGLDFDEAHAPAILERAGVLFAFLAYSYAPRRDKPGSTEPVIAGRDLAQMQRDLAAARERADVVIVSLHDGAEYTQRVARKTENFCRAAIEAGATAVFGHHPHVPQRIERHADGWIFYSLGNFVFQQNDPGTRTGLLARLVFAGKQLEQVEVAPVVIEWHSQPRLADEEEARAILTRLGLQDRLLWSASAAAPAQVGHD